MKKSHPLIYILLAAGCIDPVNLRLPGGGTLVVDGWVTDQPGPYIVKLSRSIPFDNSQPLKVYSIPEKNARVIIQDDQGNQQVLTTNSTAGWYQTSGMTGRVGKSYQLLIETSDGKKYRSSIEQMLPVPSIASIETHYQISEVLFINTNGDARVQKKEDFGIYVNINDPVGTENYYRWTATGIFEFYSLVNNTDFNHCWAPTPGRLESKLELSSDLFFDGKPYRQYLGVFPYDRPTMYLVHVNQESLTKGGYTFLNKVSTQQTSTGTLFDPPPAPVSGNMVCESSSDETVLGYFGVSSIISAELLVNRFKESGYVNPSRNKPMRDGDCRGHEPNATNIKPAGF